ncbi:MAG: glycogen synthase [Actinomycetota bacterium]|jgi:glycosyltransferase involved in cell wall biosynthesis
MRILVVTNLFPPVVIGGYEMGCEQQISRLRSRGHDVTVLTSSWKRDEAPEQSGVHRVLPISFEPTSFWVRSWREIRSQRAARRVLRAAPPDVTYVFNVRWISRSVLFLAQEHAPVAYFVSDPWLADEMLEDGWAGPWQRQLSSAAPSVRSSVARVVSALLPDRVARTRFGQLDLEHVTFSSDAVRRDAVDAGHSSPDAPIIHCAVDVVAFRPRPPVDQMLRFLYVGQVMPHKGVKTALTAFFDLCRAHPDRHLELSLVGGTMWPDYEEEIRAFVHDSGLAERIRFVGSIDKAAMPALYATHDALIFPSEWEEPFSLVLLEAMASGLPIVATMTGGTPEIAVPDGNVLAFDAGDAADCRSQLERLFDLDVARRLQTAARATVETRFTIEGQVDAVEESLRAVAVSGS